MRKRRNRQRKRGKMNRPRATGSCQEEEQKTRSEKEETEHRKKQATVHHICTHHCKCLNKNKTQECKTGLKADSISIKKLSLRPLIPLFWSLTLCCSPLNNILFSVFNPYGLMKLQYSSCDDTTAKMSNVPLYFK